MDIMPVEFLGAASFAWLKIISNYVLKV